MAGFDFSIAVRSDAENALIRRLLHGLQLRARQRWVEVRYRRTDSSYTVTVDGTLIQIQSSRTPIAIALGGIADASVDLRFPRHRRLQIGRRVLRGYVRGAWDSTIGVLDLARSMGGTPMSVVFDGVDDPVIQYRLDCLTDVLETWNNEDAPTEHALEELHATAELTMGYILGDGWDDRSFAEQAAEMVARGKMTSEHRDALIELKNRRRQVRHHLGTMSRTELRGRLVGVLPAIHAIVSEVPEVAR